jgi:hypothetical protein
MPPYPETAISAAIGPLQPNARYVTAVVDASGIAEMGMVDPCPGSESPCDPVPAVVDRAPFRVALQYTLTSNPSAWYEAGRYDVYPPDKYTAFNGTYNFSFSTTSDIRQIRIYLQNTSPPNYSGNWFVGTATIRQYTVQTVGLTILAVGTLNWTAIGE